MRCGNELQARGRHMDGALAARLKTTSMVLPATDELRKVCLAFESVEVGQHMLAWATKYCLFPDDEVYIVHCLSKVPPTRPSGPCLQSRCQSSADGGYPVDSSPLVLAMLCNHSSEHFIHLSNGNARL